MTDCLKYTTEKNINTYLNIKNKKELTKQFPVMFGVTKELSCTQQICNELPL